MWILILAVLEFDETGRVDGSHVRNIQYHTFSNADDCQTVGRASIAQHKNVQYNCVQLKAITE